VRELIRVGSAGVIVEKKKGNEKNDLGRKRGLIQSLSAAKRGEGRGRHEDIKQ